CPPWSSWRCGRRGSAARRVPFSRWKELYELRCLVAHNAMLTKADIEKIERLVSQVRPKLVEAINNLPSVSVPADQMEAVAESAVRNVSESLGCFITIWQRLE